MITDYFQTRELTWTERRLAKHSHGMQKMTSYFARVKSTTTSIYIY